MKKWDKNRGWLIECMGGPNAGNCIRAYNVDAKTKEEAPFDLTFEVQGHQAEGHYCLKPLYKANGKDRKMARRNGEEVPAWYYQWVSAEELQP